MKVKLSLHQPTLTYNIEVKALMYAHCLVIFFRFYLNHLYQVPSSPLNCIVMYYYYSKGALMISNDDNHVINITYQLMNIT